MQRLTRYLRIKKRVKATGLAETVVALGVLSVTMVTTIGISIQSTKITKRTEIEDRANGVMIRALEYAKSPAEFNVSPPILNNDVVSFSVQFEQDGSTTLRREVGRDEISTDNCNDSSSYYVDMKAIDVDSIDTICSQVILRAREEGGRLVYEINSIVVVNIFGEYQKENILGYRYSGLN